MIVNRDENRDSSEKDLRYLPRWEVNNRILLQRENEVVPRECLSKDINAIGACVRTTDDIALNSKLTLTIYLAKNIAPIEVFGKVVWRQQLENENQLGVKFERMSDKTSDLIFQYAFEYKKEDLIKRWYRGFS